MGKEINISALGDGNSLRKAIDSLTMSGMITAAQKEDITSKLGALCEDIGKTHGKTLKITCAGVYNSGKSSLLNALTDSRHFKVGDIPTTDSIDEYICGDITYVDTPGLNANDMDNATAVRAFKDADLILFVSNIQNGGLNAAEAKYLTALSEILGGNDNLRRQTLFVMSNLHQTEDEQAAKISAEHRSNIEKTFGFAPDDIMLYDAVSYETGVAEKQKALIDDSGIPALKKQISERAKEISDSSHEISSDRISSKSGALAESLSSIVEQLKKELSKLAPGKSVDKSAVQAAIKECGDIIKAAADGIVPYSPASGMDVLLNPISHDMSPFRGESSEYAAKRRIREKLSRAYQRRESVLKDAASRVAEMIMCYNVYNRNPGNYYYDINHLAADAVARCNKLFKNAGVILPAGAIADIEVVPSLCNTSQRELRDIISEDVIEYSGYYSLDSYVDYCDVEEEFKEFGKFGREKYTYGCYNLYKGADEMVKDMKSSFNSNVSSAWRPTISKMQDFCSKVIAELESRRSAMVAAAEAELSKPVSGGDADKLKAMISRLEAYLKG